MPRLISQLFLAAFLMALAVPMGALVLPDERQIWVGALDDRLEVFVDLRFIGGEIEGHYCYAHIGESIALAGECVYNDGPLYRMIESVAGEETGRWSIRPAAEHTTLTGTWVRPDGTGQAPVHLRMVARYELKSHRVPTGSIETQFPVLEQQGPLATALAALGRRVEEEQDAFLAMSRRDLSDPELAHIARRGGYGMVQDWALAYVDDTLVSVLGHVWQYTGGAHGNFVFESRLFAQIDGEVVVLQWEDFLVGNDLNAQQDTWLAVEAMLYKGLREQGASYAQEGNVLRLPMDSARSFAVNPAGLTVYFPPYAVGSYAEGAYAVVLSWGDLAGLIDPDCPLGRWVE